MASGNISSKPSEVRATSSRIRFPAVTRTVRFRLTLWYSSLLLVFGLAFVIALNVAARVSHPETRALAGVDANMQVGPAAEPGGAIDTRQPRLDAATIVNTAEEQLYQENLERLKTWSLVAVVGLVVTSAIGGYVVSGVLLGPVREISRVASEIGATNLSRRINHQGVDDELKDLADTFDSMIGRLEAAFKSQQQFVQDASHELRTPLTAIRTNIEVTEMDPSSTASDYRELTDLVKVQTDRLTHLADDLLLLTGPSTPPDLSVVSIDQLLAGVVRQLSAVATLRGTEIRVTVPEDLSALAEEDALFRSVSNLVDNAIKYSGDNSFVNIDARRDGDEIEISVADAGQGISQEALPHVFERFYRVDRGRSRREGGSGLGLAIVRQLITNMGGRVSVSSPPGEGATFSIHLPVPPTPHPTSEGGRELTGTTYPVQGLGRPSKHPN